MATATANDVITAALKRLSVIEYDETPDAAQAADGLTMLNQFMHGLRQHGVAYAHRDLAATDTVNMPDDCIEPLIMAFAEKLEAEYMVPADPRRTMAMRDARRTLQAAFLVAPNATPEPALRYGGTIFDIATGGLR